MTPAIADTLVDKIVAELQTAITERFEFSLPFEISARDLPDFDQIQAADTTLIQVAAAPNVELARSSRENVNQTIKVGIGVCKLLKKDAAGRPESTEFRELKSLMQAIYVWAHAGVDSFRDQAGGVSLPAWYDFNKAVAGTFLSVVSVNYDTKFLV